MSCCSAPLTLSKPDVVRFHLSLNISNLEKSVAFYRTLFGMEPAKLRADYAKFEPNDPPLVLSLEPSGKPGPGTLNHLGIRLPDSKALVSLQERLEMAGIKSQREEGVECCYARQTKFWVTDPDGTLWELYTLHEDIDHRGTGQTRESMIAPSGAVWMHRLGDPIPDRIGYDSGSLDEATLRGSFNVPLDSNSRVRLLSEARRALKPNGRLVIQALTGDREVQTPALGGPAAKVELVPTKDSLIAMAETVGFQRIRLTKYSEHPCFVKDGVEMRETHIEGWKG